MSLLTSIVRKFLIKHGFELQNETPQRYSGLQPTKKRQRTCGNKDQDRRCCPVPAKPDEQHVPIIDLHAADGGNDQDILWTDPYSGTTFVLDQRTGNSYPVNEDRNEDNPEQDNCASTSRRTLDGFVTRNRKPQSPPAWITQALGVSEPPSPCELVELIITYYRRIRLMSLGNQKFHRYPSHRVLIPWRSIDANIKLPLPHETRLHHTYSPS